MSALEEIRQALTDAIERVGPAVVGLGRGWQPGSGVVVEEGRVLTSAHNLGREPATVTFGDGRTAESKLAGIDPGLDLALLSADTGSVAPVPWDAGEPPIAVGSPVVAMANPGGRGLRATLGFVSAAGRSFRGPGGRLIEGCIEHTAPLPRGSSGGPLVDPEGRLLGLNAIRLEGGLILAVPAGERARARVEAMARGEVVTPVRLGVAVAPAYLARRLRRSVGLPERDGVLVRSVQEGSAADHAGLERGDLIVAAAAQPVDGVDSLHRQLEAVGPGESLELTLLRGENERELTVSFDRDEEDRDHEREEAAT